LQPFRLAHLSDPHLQPPPGALRAADFASKRLLSAIAWRRKGREHQPRVLEALTADIAAYAPDHIALTGDLTNFSTQAEFAAARAWLQTLGAPGDITLSPGNHDALVATNAPDSFAPWREWLEDPGDTAFPAVRRRGPVALVNLCSATPTAPWLASGRLGEEQLSKLRPILAGLRQESLFRVVLIHHPPAPGVVSRRKALEDAPALRAMLEAEGAELVLHGHAHEAAVSTLQGPKAAIPVLGVPSASAAGHGKHPAARWHGIEIDPAQRKIRVVARGLSQETGAFEPLGSYLLDTAQG
jgi:3',5'-cyclic AMP phosphodiesterase CpdA